MRWSGHRKERSSEAQPPSKDQKASERSNRIPVFVQKFPRRHSSPFIHAARQRRDKRSASLPSKPSALPGTLPEAGGALVRERKRPRATCFVEERGQVTRERGLERSPRERQAAELRRLREKRIGPGTGASVATRPAPPGQTLHGSSLKLFHACAGALN